MRPYGEVPSGQFLLEKSSVKDVSDERVLLLELLLLFVLRFTFAFEFRFALRFALLFALATRLPLSFVILAIANIRITSPIPSNARMAPIPNSQGQTLRFLG